MLGEIAKALQEVWIVKVRALMGPGPSDDKEISILNRIVRWTEEGLLYEADPRHVEKLLRDAGMEDCKPITTPGVNGPKSSGAAWFEKQDDGEDVIEGYGVDGGVSAPDLAHPAKVADRQAVTGYRSSTARCNCLATDRFEIAFATKELCRDMANPTEASVQAGKRMRRFLKGMPRMVQKIHSQIT